MDVIRYSHDELPAHDCHHHRCEGCGLDQWCCDITWMKVPMGFLIPVCEDKAACDLRIHRMTHGTSDAIYDCTYCMFGTDICPPLPFSADTLQQMWDKMPAPPEPTYPG